MGRVEHSLVLLRHAKSDRSGGERDVDRPLTRRGRRQAPEAGRWLAAHRAPGLAVVSPARRARDTWDLVAAELVQPPEVRVDDRVYAATARELLEVVRELPEDAATVVLVGHNPGLEDLAALLTGAGVAMPTSALVVLAVPGPWSGLAARVATVTASGRPPADVATQEPRTDHSTTPD